MMTCRQMIDSLGEWLETSLRWRKQLALGFHWLTCHECRRYLRSYRQAISLAKRSQLTTSFPPVPAALLAAIVKARGSG